MADETAQRQPNVWAVHDGKIGMASQVLGLVEALGWPFTEKVLKIRSPWRYLSSQFWLNPFSALDPAGDRFESPWPDVIVSCGNMTVAPALAAKRASGGRIFWVQIQDPRFARRHADLVVAPSHDPMKGPNVFKTVGAVHRVTPEKLAEGARRFAPQFEKLPRPLAAVLIGGDNRVYRLSKARLDVLVKQLAGLAQRGFGLAITVSRRTGAASTKILRERLEPLGAYIWDGKGENPYFGLLALADVIIVTSDSVSMVSEAAFTGKPVHVFELEGGSAKFARFHQALRDAGATRPFRGAIERWQYTPPNDTMRAAEEIRRRYAARKVPHRAARKT
jgi:mitochondrial fission protein ELM1